jgi:hypothetical protein
VKNTTMMSSYHAVRARREYSHAKLLFQLHRKYKSRKALSLLSDQCHYSWRVRGPSDIPIRLACHMRAIGNEI